MIGSMDFETTAPDVPSPIDFSDPAQALAWVDATVAKRPWRQHFFTAFAHALNSLPDPSIRVLELGSGPGHLAKAILTACPRVTYYAAIDFSPAMHDLARTHGRIPLSAHKAKHSAYSLQRVQSKTPHRLSMVGRFGMGTLALTYFLTGNLQYHRREGVSRSCSGWEGVVPPCYGHQSKTGVCRLGHHGDDLLATLIRRSKDR